MEGTGEIGVDDRGPCIGAHCRQRRIAGDAGVVHQHVDLAEMFDGLGKEALAGARVGNVALQGQRGDACGAQLGECLEAGIA
ncbi:hypothetical protein D3C86_1679020 [compost metagenome]